jgi:hypothetical protein
MALAIAKFLRCDGAKSDVFLRGGTRLNPGLFFVSTADNLVELLRKVVLHSLIELLDFRQNVMAADGFSITISFYNEGKTLKPSFFDAGCDNRHPKFAAAGG